MLNFHTPGQTPATVAASPKHSFATGEVKQTQRSAKSGTAVIHQVRRSRVNYWLSSC